MLAPCLCLLTIVFLSLSPASLFAATWYITPDGNGDAPTIQDGINAAAPGDTVLVAAGTYLEHLTVKSDLVLASELGPASTFIDGQGLATVIAANAVVNTVIEGFTIRNGQGTGGNSGRHGGGLALTDCGPTCVVSGNVIRDNHAWDGGGVIIWRGLGPTIVDNVFEDNYAHAQSSSAYGLGGAIFMSNITATIPRPQIENNVFARNNSDRGGSAIASFQSCEPQILNNIFYDNIDQNQLPGFNGTIAIDYLSPVVRGNLIVRSTGGSAISIFTNASPIIENTIIAFNQGTTSIVCSASAQPFFSCCDIYGNAGGDWVNCAASFLGQNGNISADPLFCDFDGDDFSLAGDSPCLPANGDCATLIGPFGQGCMPVSIEELSWGAIKAKFK